MDKDEVTIKRIVEKLDLNMGVLITVDDKNCLSMSAATRDGIESPVASMLLSRISAVLFPRGGGDTVNKLPI